MTNNQINSHIFTNKEGNTLMREFEGVLSNNPLSYLLPFSH